MATTLNPTCTVCQRTTATFVWSFVKKLDNGMVVAEPVCTPCKEENKLQWDKSLSVWR